MTAGTIPGHKTAPAKPINPKPAMITQSSPRRWGARAVKNIPKHTITRMSEQAISQIGRQVWTMLSDVNEARPTTKAGIKSPPKTMDELTADAKKLTQRDSKGNIKVAGFDPLIGFYENVPERMITSFGGKWRDAKGHAILANDSAWTKLAKWQKSLVDWYGYNKLVKFQTGLGDEFSASNAFEKGKLALHLDGEWRVAFIADEHPSLKYGTAPMPVDSAHQDLYGSGYINGTIIGIPRGVKHKSQAWDLVKYLTTNSHALAILSNGLRNVPTTRTSLKSPEIKPDAHFATFLRIFGNSHSSTSPITAAGVSYTDAVSHFFQQWQAGKVKDLAGGLKSLDKQLDAMVSQAGGP